MCEAHLTAAARNFAAGLRSSPMTPRTSGEASLKPQGRATGGAGQAHGRFNTEPSHGSARGRLSARCCAVAAAHWLCSLSGRTHHPAVKPKPCPRNPNWPRTDPCTSASPYDECAMRGCALGSPSSAPIQRVAGGERPSVPLPLQVRGHSARLGRVRRELQILDLIEDLRDGAG